jgi:subtilase family serine protease
VGKIAVNSALFTVVKSPKNPAVKVEGIRNFLVLAVLAVLLVLANAEPSYAGQRQLLSRHIPVAIEQFHLQSIGHLPAGQRLSVAIGLPMRDQAGFEELLSQIYNPASPQYHHYLTPDQITDRFGPTEGDYNAVIAFAKTNGLTVVHARRGRTLLTVEGAVADIEKTFHVRMLLYNHPTESRAFYAPDTEPSVELNVPLLHISGLDNYTVPHPGGYPGNGHSQDGGKYSTGSGPGGNFLGNDFRAAYVPGTSLTGSGQSVGLLELDGYYTSDIETYEELAGVTNLVTINNVLVDGASGNPDSDDDSVGEVSLDMEMVIAMAPGISQLIVYEAPNSGITWEDILTQMQEDDSAKQLSSSWLFTYDDPNADITYKKFAMQGQSFFQCSGDYLAFYKGVSQWTDDPYVTLVGGTKLSTANGSWSSETVWTNGDGVVGSGGGVSASFMGNYAIPGWQKGVSMTASGGSTTNRNVPDVSMIADHVWVVWNGGETGSWWGTSIAAPLWAGMTALANQQAASHSGPFVGFLNPALYAIGEGTLYTSCFHDITTGNNVDSGTANL